MPPRLPRCDAIGAAAAPRRRDPCRARAARPVSIAGRVRPGAVLLDHLDHDALQALVLGDVLSCLAQRREAALARRHSRGPPSEHPRLPGREAWQHCSRHGGTPPQQGDLDLVPPSRSQRPGRSAVAAARRLLRREVERARGGRVRATSRGPHHGPIDDAGGREFGNLAPVSSQLPAKRRLRRVAGRIGSVGGRHTHTPRAALRPGAAAFVRMSAGLDCVVMSPVGSVVVLGSARFRPRTSSRTTA